eukprot:155801-Rhodomonas_salina.4
MAAQFSHDRVASTSSRPSSTRGSSTAPVRAWQITKAGVPGTLSEKWWLCRHGPVCGHFPEQEGVGL